MQINETRQAGAVVVAPVGRIDSTTSPALDAHLLGLAKAGEQRVVIDFSGVDYISSAGLRVMLTLAKRTKEAKGKTGPRRARRFRAAGLRAGGIPAAVLGRGHCRGGGGQGIGRVNLRVRVEAPGAPAVDSVIDAAEIVIGRTAKPPGILVTDPSVSRQHARIVVRDGGWWIEALSPTNPTFVNQIAIEAAMRTARGRCDSRGPRVDPHSGRARRGASTARMRQAPRSCRCRKTRARPRASGR